MRKRVEVVKMQMMFHTNGDCNSTLSPMLSASNKPYRFALSQGRHRAAAQENRDVRKQRVADNAARARNLSGLMPRRVVCSESC